jgi:hypothetical protein
LSNYFAQKKESKMAIRSTATMLFWVTVVAVKAQAGNIAIPFSGSGASGSIAPGEPWEFHQGLGIGIWAIPGVDNPGAVPPWNGGVSGIEDFTITFTDLPAGARIISGSILGCAGIPVFGPGFCSWPTASPNDQTMWTPAFSNDGVTFTAPAGVSLGPGQSFELSVGLGFANFDVPSSVSFTGGWSAAVPEPGTLACVMIGLIGVIIYPLCRRSPRCYNAL